MIPHRNMPPGAPPRRWVAAALVHHPVRDAHGAEIAATCHQLDLLDAGRLSLCYPLAAFYIVQPIAAQRDLVRRLVHHTSSPTGGPERDVATRGDLSRIALCETLADAIAAAREAAGGALTVMATTARPTPGALSWGAARARIADGAPTLVLFGKASGLTDAALAAADVRLAPLSGGTGFDHLPVRAAMAIALDRLLGV